MEMVAESMNDDFSRHLSAAIGCLVRETVKEVVAEMEEQRTFRRRYGDILLADDREELHRNKQKGLP